MQKMKGKSRLKRTSPIKGQKRLYQPLTGKYIYVSQARLNLTHFARVFLATIILSGLFYIGGHPQSTQPEEVQAANRVQQNEEVQETDQLEPVQPKNVTPTPVVAKNPGKKEVMAEIVRVFGEGALHAIAIAKAESGLDPHREGIHRANTLWEGYKGECSIGLFQINLASDGCYGKLVHASKIPGETLDEKIIWLKDYKNNIQIAKEIYDAQGFGPWSTYTSKKYQAF